MALIGVLFREARLTPTIDVCLRFETRMFFKSSRSIRRLVYLGVACSEAQARRAGSKMRGGRLQESTCAPTNKAAISCVGENHREHACGRQQREPAISALRVFGDGVSGWVHVLYPSARTSRSTAGSVRSTIAFDHENFVF